MHILYVLRSTFIIVCTYVFNITSKVERNLKDMAVSYVCAYVKVIFLLCVLFSPCVPQSNFYV